MEYLQDRICKVEQYLDTTEFLSKISNKQKISNEQCNLCGPNISLDKILRSANSPTNYKSSGNDGLTGIFYKHFSNDLQRCS